MTCGIVLDAFDFHLDQAQPINDFLRARFTAYHIRFVKVGYMSTETKFSGYVLKNIEFQ